MAVLVSVLQVLAFALLITAGCLIYIPLGLIAGGLVLFVIAHALERES